MSPSQWAVQQFGPHAETVVACVVDGLRRYQRAARRVQLTAESEGRSTRRPYGAMWDGSYTHVADQLSQAELPGYRSYRPRGASYELAVVNDRVIIPFRHATTLRRPISQARIETNIPVAEARRWGIEPPPTLFDLPEPDAARPSAAGAARAAHEDGTVRVVYVGYVANAESDDILAAWWGEPDSVDDEGNLAWSPEPLPLGDDARRAPSPDAVPGFADGEVPALFGSSRPRGGAAAR